MKNQPIRRLMPLAVACATLSGAAISLPAWAQNQANTLALRTQQRMNSLFQVAGKSARDLRLSAAQQAKLKTLAQKNAPLAKAIWSDASLSQTQKLGKIRALQNQASAVFTPAQKQQLAIAKTTAMMKMFETASWVSGELALNSDQQQKIQGIVMKSYRRGSASQGSFGALRDLMMDTNNQIDGVLSAAQRAKWSVIKGTARREFAKNARVLAALSRV